MELGRKQKLVVVKTVDFGVYLGDRPDAGETDRVLLPGKEVLEGTKEGDQMEVFLYKDSSDRLIATTRTPALMMDQVGLFESCPGDEDRSIPGLGTGKRPVPSI